MFAKTNSAQEPDCDAQNPMRHAVRDGPRTPCLQADKLILPGTTGGVRVGLLVGFPEAPGAHMCVDLRGRQALVPQKLLNTAQIGTTVQQVRCKTVTQRVG